MVLLFLAKNSRENDSIDIILDLAWDLGWGFPPHQNMDNMVMIRHQIQGGSILWLGKLPNWSIVNLESLPSGNLT